MLMLAACGSVSEPLPPNTQTACERGVSCRFVAPDDVAKCVACLEHWDAQPGVDLPAGFSLDGASCEALENFAADHRIIECIDKNWWGQ